MTKWKRHEWDTMRRWISGGVAALILILVGIRLYLPTLIKNYSNTVLNRIPGYHGHIEDVRIHLWRSAYSIVGLDLLKTNGKAPVPFFSSRQVDFSLHWGALFHGQLVGKLEIDHPKLNFVAGGSQEEQQTFVDRSWRQQVKALFPLRISRLGIKSGEIHFRNYHADPPVDIFIHQVNAVASNLTNSRKVSRTLKATLDAQGLAMDSGRFRTHVDMDPLVERPNFAMAFELETLSLPELNTFFRHYLAVEMKTGTFSLYSEGAAKDGQFKGYAKPLLDHVDLIKMKENPSLGEALKAIAVKFVGYVMKNHAKNRLATKMDITGTVDNPEANTWTAAARFLGNWLFKAIQPGLEGNLRVSTAKNSAL